MFGNLQISFSNYLDSRTYSFIQSTSENHDSRKPLLFSGGNKCHWLNGDREVPHYLSTGVVYPGHPVWTTGALPQTKSACHFCEEQCQKPVLLYGFQDELMKIYSKQFINNNSWLQHQNPYVIQNKPGLKS